MVYVVWDLLPPANIDLVMLLLAIVLSVLLCKYTIHYLFWVPIIHFDLKNWERN